MNKVYIPALITTLLMAGLHSMASEWHWYVRFPGFDIFMHLLGGAALALAVYWSFVTFFPKYPVSFWMVVRYAFLLGIAWEVMEAMHDITGAPVGTAPYYFDTLKDLVNDTLGAIIAMYFVWRK
jgi:hypothetical protein